MKHHAAALLLAAAFMLGSCNFVESPATASPIPTQQEIKLDPTTTPVVIEPNLTHHPLYWFAPLAPMPTRAGRPFIGSDDFLDLFKPDAPWEQAAGSIQVFKLYGEWIGNHPNDSQLRQVIADLNRRGLAIAMEAGPLDPIGCGEGIEGFATVEASVWLARQIKAAGGTLRFIALDEPYYFGHFYDGDQACHWTADKIAAEVGEYIQALRNVFPEVIIGDTEPTSGPAGAQQYNDWLDIFRKVNGYPLAFLHLDIDWSRASWPEEVKAIQQHGQQVGVPIGIIYSGNSFDTSDQDFLQEAGQRVKKLELVTGVQPDHVLFQSWNDKPDRVLPETDPYTWTGFIKTYFTDKSALGYQGQGEGANLALDKPVRISTQLGERPGTLAVDGDLGTFWGAGSMAPQWIEVDLGDEYDLTEIRMTTSQYPAGRTVHRIKGKGSGTGNELVLLHELDGNTQDGDELVFKPEAPIPGIRYIRIETISSPSWVSWREIEVFGE